MVIVILDRNEGGADALRNKGYKFVSLLSADNKGNVSINP
jgi:orotate phosphoribosyltransferase